MYPSLLSYFKITLQISFAILSEPKLVCCCLLFPKCTITMTSLVSWDLDKVKVDTAKETSQTDHKLLGLTVLLYVLEREERGKERERQEKEFFQTCDA